MEPGRSFRQPKYVQMHTPRQEALRVAQRSCNLRPEAIAFVGLISHSLERPLTLDMKPAPAISSVPCCDVRRELATEFAISARLFAEAVAILTQSSSVMADIEQLHTAAQKAQERSEHARVAFEEHVRGHRC